MNAGASHMPMRQLQEMVGIWVLMARVVPTRARQVA
jgi:hypothetical protein